MRITIFIDRDLVLISLVVGFLVAGLVVLEDRVDEILKKSKYRTLKETLKLWGLITITNGNILASIFILICC